MQPPPPYRHRPLPSAAAPSPALAAAAAPPPSPPMPPQCVAHTARWSAPCSSTSSQVHGRRHAAARVPGHVRVRPRVLLGHHPRREAYARTRSPLRVAQGHMRALPARAQAAHLERDPRPDQVERLLYSDDPGFTKQNSYYNSKTGIYGVARSSRDARRQGLGLEPSRRASA